MCPTPDTNSEPYKEMPHLIRDQGMPGTFILIFTPTSTSASPSG